MSAFDLIVVGGGPGGYVAAIRAAQLGFATALIERKHLGGICLNWGCIPTKALLRSADLLHAMQQASDYGLTCSEAKADFDAVIKRSRKVSAKLSQGVHFLMKKNKITVIDGEARCVKPGTLAVSGKDQGTYSAPHIILATGARPRTLPGIEPDGKKIWTYFEALAPDAFPKRLAILGSGAIGSEFASFYASMGTEVTLIEALDRILPVEEPEISAHVHQKFTKAGIKVHTGAKVSKVSPTREGLNITWTDAKGKSQGCEADRMISAVGVVGNVENLGLETLGVKVEGNRIVTDPLGRTNIKGLYAIGDVAGPPMLAHKAEHEGVICVETIKGLNTHPLARERIPACTYCHPEVASIGLKESEAKKAGREITVGRFPLMGNGKAVAIGEADGLIKTIFDRKTGALVGAHMVGPSVTEMIQGFSLAMTLETTEEELFHAIFPHPTVSEAMHESALAAFGRAIHV